jgi:hypothetical protein
MASGRGARPIRLDARYKMATVIARVTDGSPLTIQP